MFRVAVGAAAGSLLLGSDGHTSDGGVRAPLAPLFTRYRVDLAVPGHNRNFAAAHGSGTVVYGDAKSNTGPYVSEKDFSVTYETVDWSQARYADCGFIALDVAPAPAGTRTTMTLRFINQQGRQLDRVVCSRISGNP